MTTQDETPEIARAITTAEHGVCRLIAALAQADDIAKPNQRRNTDGVVDLRRQLPKVLARMSPEGRGVYWPGKSAPCSTRWPTSTVSS